MPERGHFVWIEGEVENTTFALVIVRTGVRPCLLEIHDRSREFRVVVVKISRLKKKSEKKVLNSDGNA